MNPPTKENVSAHSDLRLTYSYLAYEDHISVQINNVFNPKKSWLNNLDKVTLKHERTRFALAEITARLARLFTENIYIENLESLELGLQHLQGIIDHETQMLDSLSRLYDTETDFGRNRHPPRNWNRFVRKNLKALRAYRHVSQDLEYF